MIQSDQQHVLGLNNFVCPLRGELSRIKEVDTEGCLRDKKGSRITVTFVVFR